MNLDELLEKFRAEEEGSILSASNRDDHGMPSETFGEEPEGSILPPNPENGQETANPDPVSIAERIGIRFEQEIPIPEGTGGLGKPVFTYRGQVLSWEADPPHIRLYAWATVHLFPGRPLPVDIDSTARLLELSPREVRDSLARLVREEDLERTMQRGGRLELYRLIVRYPEGGNDEDRD